MVNGDRAELVNARVYGQHDTFYTGLKRVYLKDSYINGSVDFLCKISRDAFTSRCAARLSLVPPGWFVTFSDVG